MRLDYDHQNITCIWREGIAPSRKINDSGETIDCREISAANDPN
jgi:hypothetical protein